jgi:hypothetical protein
MPFCDCKQNGGSVLQYLVILSVSVCRHIFLLEQITWSHIDAAATTAVLLCNSKFCADGM